MVAEAASGKSKTQQLHAEARAAAKAKQHGPKPVGATTDAPVATA